MAIKKFLRNGKVKHITIENKDQRIRRLEALVETLTKTLSEVMDYDKAVAAVSTYDCYN